MGKHFISAGLLSAAMVISGAAHAADWTLDGAASQIAFGSIKNDYNGESHVFTGLSGGVKGGMADITIDLTSVDTRIDIRNERMGEHVFKGMASAALTAEMDMSAMEALAPGESTTIELDATLTLLGEEVPVFTPVFVTRVGDDKVMVTSDELIYLATDELGVDEGIDMLQSLAKLDNIARSVPITFRLMFNEGDQQS